MVGHLHKLNPGKTSLEWGIWTKESLIWGIIQREKTHYDKTNKNQ